MPRATFQKVKTFFETNERLLIPAMLLTGLLIDVVTFASIKIGSAFLILAVHLVVAGFLIAFIRAFDSAKSLSFKPFQYLRLAAPFILQFNFGALLSASLIFYWFSGTFSVSWPIMGTIIALIISNDTLRKHYLKPIVQISVHYFTVFSFLALALPFLFNSISAWVFLTAGILSYIIISAYITLLTVISKSVRHNHSQIRKSVLTIFITMNALYFLNIIPPIPLALRDAGAYHLVNRENGNYNILTEKESFLQSIIPGQTLHLQPGDPAYVFTSIFSPADLDTQIVHHWQYYNSQSSEWESEDKLSFSITGGREGGFRGHTRKSSLKEGKWRVDVETKRGQVLGRIKFNIEYATETPELERIIK
jgi:hypothetical protein